MHISYTKAPSQRQLKVGEIIRHTISAIFMENEYYDPRLEEVSITISEVRVSPDLKNATVYVSPLAKEASEDFIGILNEIAPQIKYHLAKRVKLRFIPKIVFMADNSYEYAAKIEKLIHDNKEGE